MISLEGFHSANSAIMYEQAAKTKSELRRIMQTKVIDWDVLVGLLATNASLLDFSGSEFHKIAKKNAERQPDATLLKRGAVLASGVHHG